ncbi:Sensor kinase cusS [hydrothermal vent metagenome]|uniref:histidine kinase n=1 Tax=hydrothermal vent metagenome TaxID=652676 RepID=A0A1W1C8W4_9ZZZZ
MLSQKSLKNRFVIELSVSMTAILLFAIIILSIYFSITLKNNIKQDMHIQASYIINNYSTQQEYDENINKELLKKLSGYEIYILSDKNYKIQKDIVGYEKKGEFFLELTKHYPYQNRYVKIKRNISKEQGLISNMYSIVLGMIIIGIIFIIFFSYVLSKKLMQPIELLTNRFTNMNESMLQYLDLKELPIEFSKLGESINFLITKIQTFINYRKELYVGTAHELKTPLAVMRLKNQITLMKYKQQDKIKETLQQNIESIDTLNSMIHNILEYGRAEGAQFEQPQRINLIRFMASKAEEYELLAQSQNRKFMYHFSVSDFRINVQPLLFMQIFQNFIQNALRFTPENGLVRIETRMDEENFIVEIIDEGKGIDESKDLFAPFQRSQESTGAGLGLFLAQNAAQSMGVLINIENRSDNIQGAIASIRFPLNRFLRKD